MHEKQLLQNNKTTKKMTAETFGLVAAAVGLAEIIRMVLSKIFSKKSDEINENKDEFATLRERMLFNEQQTNRLNKALTKTNLKVLKTYAIVTELTKKSCGKDCPMREIVNIDLGYLDDDTEDLLNMDDIDGTNEQP